MFHDLCLNYVDYNEVLAKWRGISPHNIDDVATNFLKSLIERNDANEETKRRQVEWIIGSELPSKKPENYRWIQSHPRGRFLNFTTDNFTDTSEDYDDDHGEEVEIEQEMDEKDAEEVEKSGEDEASDEHYEADEDVTNIPSKRAASSRQSGESVKKLPFFKRKY